MTTAIAHRGPDGEGSFHDTGALADVHLGHRRLAIFDPSPRGAQPMSDRSGRYTIVFNGAIYNFRELAVELARLHGGPLALRSETDTEILVEAWAALGPECLERLNGMFAFALWDAATRTLYLARDRFGVKPLFYAFLGDRRDAAPRLLFGSEAKALFASGALAPEADRRALVDFLLTHNIDHQPEGSLFAGVLQVPPAGLVIVRPGSPPVVRRYWRILPGAQRPLSNEVVAETRDLLLSSLSLRLRADVPLGGTLSGGLDSSLLTAAVAGPLQGQVSLPYRVFMSQFPGTRDSSSATGDESPWAERVLAHVGGGGGGGAVLGLRSSPDPGALRRELTQVLYHQEEPFADTSIFAHYALMKQVQAAGVKVLLTGQGADEIFAGYPSYFNVFLGFLLRMGRPDEAHAQARARVALVGGEPRRLLMAAAYHAAPGPLRERLHQRRIAQEFPLTAAGRALLRGAGRYADGGLDLLGAWGSAGTPGFGLFDRYLLDSVERWSLPHILRQDDRNTMALGIESRAPFLDYRLAELAFSTQPAARLQGGYTKRLLREAAVGLLPDDVRLRPDKIGFWSPRQGFLRAEETWVRAALREVPAELRELIDPAGLSGVVARFYEGRDGNATAPLWGALVTFLFLRDTLPRFAALSS